MTFLVTNSMLDNQVGAYKITKKSHENAYKQQMHQLSKHRKLTRKHKSYLTSTYLTIG